MDADEVLYDAAYRISDRIKSRIKVDSSEMIVFRDCILREMKECVTEVEMGMFRTDDLIAATFQRLMMPRQVDGYSIVGNSICLGAVIERVILRIELK